DAKSPRQRRGMKQDAARSWKLHFCKLLVDFVLWCPTVTDRSRLLPEAKKRRLLAELHHSRAVRIRVAGGGAGGDAPGAQASALGLPYGQPQPPKRLSPSWDTTNHSGVQ